MHKSAVKKQQKKSQAKKPVAKVQKRKIATKKVTKKQQRPQSVFAVPARQFSALERINTENAPAAVGPYSQAMKIVKGSPVFISGQLPLDPKTMKFNSDTDVSLQTEQCLTNMKAILQAGGMEMNNVVKTTILLKDMGDFAKVNKVYATFFQEPYPARVCYQVAALPLGAMVEIEAIAADKSSV